MQTAHPSVTPDRLMQFAFAYAPTLIIEAALHHRVFDLLDQGAMTVEQLSQATGSSARGLRILLNALVSLDFLAKDADHTYRLTPESATFLVTTKPTFQGGLFRHTSTQLIPKWLHLNEVVRTGKPSTAINQEAVGAEFFQQFVNDIFPTSYPAALALATALNVAQVQHPFYVLDLAAGSGVWGITLAQQSPLVHVTAIDWPGVIPVTQQNIDRFGLSDRVHCIQGDLLAVDFPTGCHLATLGHIIHSEGETRSRQLLHNVFSALADRSRIGV
jgi:hypothetical protein